MTYIGEHRVYNERAVVLAARSILKRCSNETILKLRNGRFEDLNCRNIVENEVDIFIRDCGNWAIKKALTDMTKYRQLEERAAVPQMN